MFSRSLFFSSSPMEDGKKTQSCMRIHNCNIQDNNKNDLVNFLYDHIVNAMDDIRK